MKLPGIYTILVAKKRAPIRFNCFDDGKALVFECNTYKLAANRSRSFFYVPYETRFIGKYLQLSFIFLW